MFVWFPFPYIVYYFAGGVAFSDIASDGLNRNW